jgi:hypothetical protein
MATAITPIRLAVAVTALLALSALGARSASAKPDDGWKLHYQTRAAAQLQSEAGAGQHDGYQSTAGAVYPDAFERAAIRSAESGSPDAFERAAARHVQVGAVTGPESYQDMIRQAEAARRAEVAAQQAQADRNQPDGFQPQLHPQQPLSGGADGSFDWGLFATLCALGAAAIIACGAAVAAVRHRERVSHP